MGFGSTLPSDQRINIDPSSTGLKQTLQLENPKSRKRNSKEKEFNERQDLNSRNNGFHEIWCPFDQGRTFVNWVEKIRIDLEKREFNDGPGKGNLQLILHYMKANK